MRHGQSMWNSAGLFTGWVDVPLTNQGIEEAIDGGKKIAEYDIDEIRFNAYSRTNDSNAGTSTKPTWKDASVSIS